MEVGRHTYGNILQRHHGHVKVGNFCSISTGVHAVFLWDHRGDWITTFPFYTWTEEIPVNCTKDNEIVVGNDVWIGTNVMLLGGAKIGDGSIIGACSVVAGNIPPYTVVVGNPAKPIRKRFSDEEIEALLKIEWWNWEDEKIRENIGLLSTNNVKEFIEKHLPTGGH